MVNTILIIIAIMALVFFTLGLVRAFKLARDGKPEDVKLFNKSYWTYIITSINGLLIVNLSSLLGIAALSKESIGIQQWVALIYLVILMFIFLFWALNKFNEDEKMPVVIPQMSKSFFALLLAALGIILKSGADKM